MCTCNSHFGMPSMKALSLLIFPSSIGFPHGARPLSGGEITAGERVTRIACDYNWGSTGSSGRAARPGPPATFGAAHSYPFYPLPNLPAEMPEVVEAGFEQISAAAASGNSRSSQIFGNR